MEGTGARSAVRAQDLGTEEANRAAEAEVLPVPEAREDWPERLDRAAPEEIAQARARRATAGEADIMVAAEVAAAARLEMAQAVLEVAARRTSVPRFSRLPAPRTA